MSAVDEREIIDRLQNDDQSVLAVVLRRIVPQLWPLLAVRFRESLSHEDIEEVIAGSLTKLWQNRRKFDPARGDFNGWFYVILRNSAFDLLRRRAPKVEEYLIVESLSDASHATDDEKYSALQNAIAKLNEREQQVLLPLFDRSGVSIAELSDQLSISPGAVRQLRFRALRKLNAGLAESGFTTRRIQIKPGKSSDEERNLP